MRKIETERMPRLTAGNRRLAARAIRELDVSRLTLKVSTQHIAKNAASRNESVSILSKNESCCALAFVVGQHIFQTTKSHRITASSARHTCIASLVASGRSGPAGHSIGALMGAALGDV